MSSEVEETHKIKALTSALQETKDDLIHWTLIPNEDGDTAIHLAIIRDDINLCIYLCRLLAAQGIELDIRNNLMQTPLHLACITGHSKLVENLLESKAVKVEWGDRYGNTSIHLAVKHDDPSCDIMRLILSHLFNDDDDVINAKNIKGYSALHIASSINKPEAIKLLVTHGAEIDQPDTKSGKSPLYIAVQEKNVEATQVLLELGADSNKLTYFRDSPSQLASSSDRRHLLRLISRYDSSHPASPPALGRRNSRRVGDVMIKNTHEQNNFIINESERKSSNSQDDNNTNMLLEDKMNTEVDNDKAKTKEYVAEQADLHSKIKKEVVSDDPDSVTQGNTSPPTMHYPTLITQAEYPTFPKYTSQNLRESFVPFVNPWLNFQGAIINPNAFLTQAAYGYIPTALGNSAAAQLQPTLPPFDPNGISQRNHFAAGISQWVNLSLDVARAAERLRQPRIDEESADSMNSRKRKATDDIENHRSPAKESESDNLSFSRQSAENGKRFRSHNSTAVHSEGLHRSASDDPGNSREKDEQLSSNRTLKRRNSAPSTGVAPQVLEKEDDRRVAPVDLHSYAGCLPPHCLHLLQSSGNLALSYREHALKEVEEVYQTRNHGVPITANGNTSPQSELRIQHHTNNASNGDTKTIELTRIRESDFHMAGRRPSSTLYRELWRPSGRDEGSDSAKNKTIPLHPKATYLHGSHKPESWSSYRRKLQNSSVLSYNERRRSGDKARRASETESDDEDYIQTLQISDASSDDEEYSETIANPCSDARSQGSINFGRGAWSDLDLGNLPAFGGNVAVPILNTVPRQHSTSMYATIPTKMACSVIKNVPKTLNGLPRTYTSTKLGNPTKKSVDHKAYAYEFSPHDVIREPRKELQLNDLPLTQRSTTRETKSHKCRGCSHKRASQDESRLKLIGNILQQSYSKTTYGGFQSTTPHCAPRLVFTSEIKLPSEVQHRKVFSNSEEKPAKSSGLTASAAIEERSLQRTTTTSRNSDSEYSHKLFKFARAVKENKNREPKSVGEKDSIKSSSATENRASILSGSSVLAARTGRSTSSSSTRLNSLDAKLEELRQKATEREEMNKLDRQEREAAHSEAKPVNIKTETTYSHSSTDVTSPSCSQTNVIFDAKRKLSQSPFQESESGRFSGKKNVAVIKPNQSIVSQTSRDNIPFNVGPPKKRHMKRYSPEFYKQRREVILQDREVRSASPLPQEPFVSTNVLIDNEDRSLNVRWCSPDRSPTRRKHAQNARTILTYTVPLGPLKQSRGSNSHTVRLEQNYRKHPRYASSPRSDTVIVVESRVQETLRDEIDERLEIGDLEISDDES
ncbi:uncharacterized protein LOC120325934 isoform X3 [Styela clava]